MNYARNYSGILIAALGLWAGAAMAADFVPYTAEQFSALNGKPGEVVVDVHATWCSTCAAQQAALKTLLDTDKYKKVTVLVVDFDAQKDVMSKFGVSQRSTLIVFRQGKEKIRATGVTSPGQIAPLLDTGL